jgi:alkylhydroperoxidase family enzyme
MIAEHHVPDAVYNEARQYFSEQELVNLSLAVVAINGWNRLAISFRSEFGAYRAGTVAAMAKKV